MDPDQLRLLARRQNALIDALTSGASSPDGLDAGRVMVTRRQLSMKRWRMMTKAWPSMARELDVPPTERDVRVVAAEPLDRRYPGLADGLRLATILKSEGRLGPAGDRELFATSLVWRIRNGGLVRRRVPHIALHVSADTLVIGLNVRRVWMFAVPLRRRRAAQL